MVRDAQKNYIAAIVSALQLSAATLYWTNSKAVGKYESFKHPNIYTHSPGLKIPEFPFPFKKMWKTKKQTTKLFVI